MIKDSKIEDRVQEHFDIFNIGFDEFQKKVVTDIPGLVMRMANVNDHIWYTFHDQNGYIPGVAHVALSTDKCFEDGLALAWLQWIKRTIKKQN